MTSPGYYVSSRQMTDDGDKSMEASGCQELWSQNNEKNVLEAN